MSRPRLRSLVCAALVLAATGLAGPSPRAVEVRKIEPPQPDDATLEADVRRQIAGRPDVEIGRIKVGVAGGVLSLTGTVDSLWDRSEVERLAAEIRGLKSIDNELTVSPVDAPDSLLEYDANRALETSPRIRSFGLKVSVSGAVLTLDGEVPLARDRMEAARLATHVHGIRELNNEIRVASAPVDPAVVRRHVEHLLGSKVVFAGVEDLSVEVDGEGVVTLGGTVKSFADRLTAERITYGVRGVTSVTNNLRVKEAARASP